MQRSVRRMAVFGALFLLVAGMASAAQICATGTVYPGQENCLGTISASSSMEAMGSGFNRNVRFRVYWQDIYGDLTLLYDYVSLSFTAVWDDGTSPHLFPGQFIVCAKRPSSYTEAATYKICLNPDYL